MTQCIENSEAIFLYCSIILALLGLIKSEFEKVKIIKRMRNHQIARISLRKKLDELEGKE